MRRVGSIRVDKRIEMLMVADVVGRDTAADEIKRDERAQVQYKRNTSA